jgi:hypothetical protein
MARLGSEGVADPKVFFKTENFPLRRPLQLGSGRHGALPSAVLEFVQGREYNKRLPKYVVMIGHV